MNYFNTLARDKYVINQTNKKTKIKISDFNPDELTLVMTNTDTGHIQNIEYDRFMTLLKSGYIQKLKE